jgi:hypothetical protein
MVVYPCIFPQLTDDFPSETPPYARGMENDALHAISKPVMFPPLYRVTLSSERQLMEYFLPEQLDGGR